MNEMIFWYINFEGLAICQFESGTVTHLIDNLEIILKSSVDWEKKLNEKNS